VTPAVLDGGASCVAQVAVGGGQLLVRHAVDLQRLDVVLVGGVGRVDRDRLAVGQVDLRVRERRAVHQQGAVTGVLRVQAELLPEEGRALRAEVVVVVQAARARQVDGVLDVADGRLGLGGVARVVRRELLAEVELVGDLVVHAEAVGL
jgi:hypothetical protein